MSSTPRNWGNEPSSFLFFRNQRQQGPAGGVPVGHLRQDRQEQDQDAAHARAQVAEAGGGREQREAAAQSVREGDGVHGQNRHVAARGRQHRQHHLHQRHPLPGMFTAVLVIVYLTLFASFPHKNLT